MAFQETVRRVLAEHTEREEQAGRKIVPTEKEQGNCSGTDMEAKIMRCAEFRGKDLSW